MQKKIIALAVAGLMSGAAFAQSNVTIAGRLSVGMQQYKQSGGAAGVTYANENRVSDQSSAIVFSGREDLGGGGYAFFQLDSRFGPETGAAGWSGGNTAVGLGGGWGQLSLGRWDVHYNEATYQGGRVVNLNGHLGNGIMSQVNGTNVTNASRTPNLIKYDSPNLSGFTGTIALSQAWSGAANEGTGKGGGVTGNPGAGKAWNVAGRYANGPINAALSFWNAKSEDNSAATANTDQKGTRLGGAYTFPMGLRVGLTWDKSTVGAGTNGTKTDLTRTAWMLPVSYTMGNHGMYFTYAKARNATGSAAVAGADTGAKAFTLAYDYAMSKRTAVGVSYTKLTNNTNATYQLFTAGSAGVGSPGVSANAANEDAATWYFGINHTF